MDLLADEPAMDLYDPRWPIMTSPGQLPPARLIYGAGQRGFVANSLLSGGVQVRGATITNSVLASNVHVGRHSVLDECVVLPGARIGVSCSLERAIVEDGAVIPDGTTVRGRDDASTRITLLTSDSATVPVRRPAALTSLGGWPLREAARVRECRDIAS
jgi:glucose-1-phosphate adenylyltransferase